MYTQHASTSNPRGIPIQPNAVSPDRQDPRLLLPFASIGTPLNLTGANHPGAPTHHRQVHRNDDDQQTFPVLSLPRNAAERSPPNHDAAPPDYHVRLPNSNNFVSPIGQGDSTDDSSTNTASVQTVSSAELRSCRHHLHRRELPSDVSSYASSTADSEVAIDPTVGAFKLRGKFITDFNILHVEVRGSQMLQNVLVQYRTHLDSETITRVVPFDNFNTASHKLIYACTHHPQDGRGKIGRVDPETGDIFYEIEKFLEYDETTDMVQVKWAFTQEPSSQWIARNDIPGFSVEEIKEEISENDTQSL